MRIAALCLALAALGSADALAQGEAAVEKLRACSVLPSSERLECLDKLSRDLGPPSAGPTKKAAQIAPATADWIVSETTSPLDYSPVAIASATASGGPGNVAVQLSIQCRSGRTDLVLISPALASRGEEYVVSYELPDGKPVLVPSGVPTAGTGLAIRVDVARLLASLPDHGDFAIRVSVRQTTVVEGRYALPALKATLKRMARPCNWPTN